MYYCFWPHDCCARTFCGSNTFSRSLLTLPRFHTRNIMTRQGCFALRQKSNTKNDHHLATSSIVLSSDDQKSWASRPENNFDLKASTSTPTNKLCQDSDVGDTNREDLLQFIENDVIGRDTMIESPFGPRKILYADFTASGRALESFETFLRSNILPLYANTHTTSSATGSFSTALRTEAREAILSCVGGIPSKDSVIFAGSGCTGAIMKLVNLLTRSAEWSRCMKSGKAPLVLIGPYEHHSNILPWRESGAEVVTVRESAEGGVDMRHLEELLQKASHRLLKIGSFSAASNISGIISDATAIAVMLHRYEALAFFDYASGGPYLELNMNPQGLGADAALAWKDAIFVSPHKFIGGVATPGVLVVKTDLYSRFGKLRAPANPGGGTVLFVTEEHHQYLEDIEEREEGGTPDIVGAVRCGMTFLLKNAVGHDVIMQREKHHWSFLKKAFTQQENIEILGNRECPRLAIVSFMIKHGDKYLHHNFVASLLNDLFGIQVRAGCACAGPYAQTLLEIDSEVAALYGAALLRGHNVLKPGFVRLNANFFVSESAVQYMAQAVLFVAEHGWKFLPLYKNVPGSGEWKHRSIQQNPMQQKKVLDLRAFAESSVSSSTSKLCSEGCNASSFDLYRTQADEFLRLIEAASTGTAKFPREIEITMEQLLAEEEYIFVGNAVAEAIWFVLPSSALKLLQNQSPLPLSMPLYNPFVCDRSEARKLLLKLGQIDSPARLSEGRASLATRSKGQANRGKGSPQGVLRSFQWIGARMCG